jgi:hypothetical protein
VISTQSPLNADIKMKTAGRILTIRVPLSMVKNKRANSSIGDSKKTRIETGKYNSGSGIHKRHAFFLSPLMFSLMTIGIIF